MNLPPARQVEGARQRMEPLVNWIFVAVTGIIAWHGLTYRDAAGDRDLVRTLFGCIALLFCLRVLFVDIFGLI